MGTDVKTRRVITSALLGVIASTLLAHQALAGQSDDVSQPGRQGDYAIDGEGREFRVAFPLYNRISFETNSGYSRAASRDPGQFALRVRTELGGKLDYEDDEVWWNVRHGLFDTSIWRAPEDGRVQLSATLLDARYLRHDLESFIVMPSLNDFKFPANFDIAVDYQLLRVDARVGQGQGRTIERMDVAELAFMADFIRDESYRHRLAIGPIGWYYATPGELWTHEVTPLSGGRLLYAWDQRDGLFRVRADATCGYARVSTIEVDAPVTWRGRCRAEGLLEWTPLAISDHPVSIPLQVNADVPLDNPDALDVQATLGLRWSWLGPR